LLGPRELTRRWEHAGRLIHENGVAYNVHGDPQGSDRRWELDPLPLLMPSEAWAVLSAGLAQRARLLNAVLVDIYGPQQLVREGLLPSELLYAHRGFLRPCHGLKVPNACYLHLYGAHLARSASGAWSVVADRAQTPVGAGYAVENRIVISRIFPHLFHHCQVQRLAGFFICLRDSLRDLAARYRDAPNTVLLSSGPRNPTYFEDAYLARYLGYTLVEGEDLTVRDNRVFLKTLGGLVNVDVVLRRVRDRDCDPLELNVESRHGVPGLTHAARSGNVVLANPLGTGFLEAPALMAFLPALARRLLGEALQLPSVETWWCGDKTSLSFVLSHLDRLLIRSTFGDSSSKPVDATTLSRSQKDELAARIKAAPGKYVAQELMVRSTVPVWLDNALRPRHLALRTFVVAAGDGYRVMPGALAHVSATHETQADSMFVSNGSKDVWVFSDGPVAPVTLLQPPGSAIAPRRSGNDLPSRAADNLFWLGRHLERAEGTSRLLRSIFTRMISESAPGSLTELPVLVRALTWQWPLGTDKYGVSPGEAVTEGQVMAFLFEPQHAGSLHTLLAALRRVASIVRDRISLDSWRILTRIDDDFHPAYPLGVVSLGDVLSLLNQLILNLSAFCGVAMENMTRGPGWQFLELGRRIERALYVISLLRSTLFVAMTNEHALLEALLEIGDSSMTYRSRYATNLQVGPLLDLLMTDETNPRSLPRQPSDAVMSQEQRLVISLQASVRLADVNQLSEVDDAGTRVKLDKLLETAAQELRDLASSISHKYLVHARPSRQMAEIQQNELWRPGPHSS
jgi:uncharacterized circularly permuted ATP-grasp superfamily protein/uncharacterized alpha-E superfamily protein